MNTNQLLEVLQKDPFTSLMKCSVLPLDRFLSESFTPLSAIIFNYDNSNQPGSHWVAVFIKEDGCVEYFDSYGIKPLDITLLNKIESLSSDIPVFNSSILQGNSIVCGQYCLLFLLLRARGFHINNIIDIFLMSISTHERDHIVNFFVNKSVLKSISSSLKVHNMN